MSEKYHDNIQKYASSVDANAVKTIVKYLGIALQGRDSSLVSCSDDSELKRVREGFCVKKLGLDASAADAAVSSACETMKAERNKHRVTFYYLCAVASGTLSKLT